MASRLRPGRATGQIQRCLVALTSTGRDRWKKGQRVLELLAGIKPDLEARFGVTRLALFESIARDTASEPSDVDILVVFDGPATSKRYFDVQLMLEDLLGCPVDLVTEKALRPELRPFIERERVNA